MRAGDLLTLEVEKPVTGGRMLARDGRQIVLVAGAIPGERITARVERISAHTAYATTIDVLAPSRDRREACGDPRCGGNVYAHIAYERQRALKSLVVRDAFSRIARVSLDEDPPVEPSPERGYRLRARLHARRGRVGFFREGTHDLCDPATTGQLRDASIDALRGLEDVLTRHPQIDPQGVDLAENLAGSVRVINLELPRGGQPPDSDLFTDRVLAAAVSASFGGDRTTPILGEPYVTDDVDVGFATVRLRRHVRAFFQGNRYLLSTLVRRVAAVVEGDEVLDLYAGGGLFSVPLAARGDARVTAVEGDSIAGEDLRWNGRLYGRTLRTYRRSVEEYLRARPTVAGTIIVDPPRTGLSIETSQRIGASGAQRIVYVSCDVATLARDIKALVVAGYAIARLEAFDLFPNTAHVETLALLTRNAPAG